VSADATEAGTLASLFIGDERAALRMLGLHGIFGRGRNWTTIAQRVSRRRPEWAHLLLDLRHHGGSPDLVPPHTVDATAADVARFEEAHGFYAGAVLGHSFGGKVALVHAARGHDQLMQAWVVDSTPEARAPSGSAWRMIEVVRGLPPAFASRAEAAAALVDRGYAPHVASWMASNLVHRAGVYRWRLDFDVMEALLSDFFSRDLWPMVESPPEGLEIHFIKGQQSTVLSEGACARIERLSIERGQVFLHRVRGGHWLHAENPDAVVNLLAHHLPQLA
jgi:esterase